MKYLLIAFLLIGSLHTKAQSTYDPTISFSMTDSIDEAGTTYKRKGFVEAMIYNQRTNTVAVQVRVKFYNNTTELKKLIQSYSKEIIIDNDTYVVSGTGAVVGSRSAMRTLYGVVQTPATDTTATVWRQSVFGGDSLTTPCMGQYYYLTSQFDLSNKLSLILKTIATTAASAGKLN